MVAGELAFLTTTGDLARITLHRPPLNFLNLEALRQIEQHLETIGEGQPYRALVLDSDTQAFCAGLDMSEHTAERVFLLLERFHMVIRLLNSFPHPTIAVVRGMALGAGNELIACCDFVVATEKSSFGQPEIKVGSIPSLAPLILPTLIGQRRSLDMILTGNLVDAKEAKRIGLISRAVPDERLTDTVEELLGEIRGLSKSVLQVAIQSVRADRTRELDTRLRDVESLYLNQLMELGDTAEGVKAFLENRSPKWKNE